MKKIINIILWLMLIIGGSSFFLIIISQIMANFGINGLISKIQFPLDIRYKEDFWIDSNGNMFCFIPAYQRIQIFNKDGDFLRGWFVKNIVSIYIDSNDVFNVATVNDEHVIYDLNGKVIMKKFVYGIYKRYRYLGKEKTNQDSKGYEYSFSTFPFRTKIIKVSPEGKKILLIKEPIYLYILELPFPGSFLLIFPPAVWGIQEALHKKNKKDKNFNKVLIITLIKTIRLNI